MQVVYISIGSNIEPAKYIVKGINSLRQHYGQLELSSIYESTAVGFQGDNFYNLVASFNTPQSVLQINHTLQQIEYMHGRQVDSPSFTPRTLDLDLLLFGDEIIETEHLKLPRSDILQYAFVLKPLAELAGLKQHPCLKQTYADLWQSFDKSVQPLTKVELDLT